MSEESMIERVARAIWDAQYTSGTSWDNWAAYVADGNTSLFDGRDPSRALARAAIEAMREQTLVYRDNGEVVHEMRGAPDDIWKTLLDAALT